MPFTSLSNFSLQSANYTLLASDDVVQFNCASGSLTATLLSAALVPVGKRFEIRRSADGTGTNVLTINTTSAQTVDGRASGSIKLQPSDYAVLVSDGANWQVVTLQETVMGRWENRATTVYTNNANTQIPWATTTFDTHSAMSAAGAYTVAVAGKYKVHARMYGQGATWTTGQECDMIIRKGVVNQSVSPMHAPSAFANYLTPITATDVIQCAVGDVINILISSNATSGNITNNGTAGYTYCTIEKVGN